MDNLKLCPFCGSKATHPETMIDGVVCCENPNCTAWGFPSTIEQWQLRPIEDELMETLEELLEYSEADYFSEDSDMPKLLQDARAAIAKAKGES